MKTLYLIRHAKSDWKDGSESDFDRGLNKRGRKAVVTMSNALKRMRIMPDLILSSSAKRARLTTMGLAENLGYKGEIRYLDALYLADIETMETIVSGLDKRYNTLFLVGHNPGLTLWFDLLTGSTIDNIPTLGIAGVAFPVEIWSQIKNTKAKKTFFIYPKMFKDPVQ